MKVVRIFITYPIHVNEGVEHRLLSEPCYRLVKWQPENNDQKSQRSHRKIDV